MVKNQIKLKRNIGLALITFYGLGNILGAGIYVLVGKVAGQAGYFAPLSFIVAASIAAVSAITYAEMSSRFPVSAGEAVYIDEGFSIPFLSIFVGLLIALSGMVSSAVISHGFAAYLQVFVDIPEWLIVFLLFSTLCLLTIWGIKQSVRVAAVMTLIEIIGLLLIIYIGTDNLYSSPVAFETMLDPLTDLSTISYFGVLSGAFLAFYAYIGFEDMVNVAEEVKNPERNMPKAILYCVIISTVLYSAVSLVSIMVVSPVELAKSSAPLATVYKAATGADPVVISLIGLFAVVNGALIQMIMASRLLYGMAQKNWLPQILGRVNATTRTPINSSLLTAIIMLTLALLLDLEKLAEMTSYLVLSVFAMVNLALVRIKLKRADASSQLKYSIGFPILGFISCSALVVLQLISEFK